MNYSLFETEQHPFSAEFIVLTDAHGHFVLISYSHMGGVWAVWYAELKPMYPI